LDTKTNLAALVLRSAAKPINTGSAFGTLIITSNADFTGLAEFQLYGGMKGAEVEGKLERHFASGRVPIAICSLVHIGQGQEQTFVQPWITSNIRAAATIAIKRALRKFFGRTPNVSFEWEED
jgi:hypothetical protein